MTVKFDLSFSTQVAKKLFCRNHSALDTLTRLFTASLSFDMAYGNFTLEKVKQVFSLKIIERLDIFANSKPLKASNLLTDFINHSLPIALASNSEKSRSEMLIAPILLEFIRHHEGQVNLFSGIELNVDPSKDLNGICDFLITYSPERLIITTPIITIVEAKKENITGGLGQCIAEMVAAQLFNENEIHGDGHTSLGTVYGVVTTGSVWQFLSLEKQTVLIDLREYYLSEVDRLLGILSSFLKSHTGT